MSLSLGLARTADPTFPGGVVTASQTDIAAFICNTNEARLFAVPFGPFERQT